MERMGDEFLNVSAPSSPRRAVSLENMCFYSVPSSPARKSFKGSAYDQDHDQPTTPPNAYEDANSSFEDFEFETSRRFNVSVIAADHDDTTEDGCWKQQVQQNNNQHKESLPAMAFADELFYNGIVMPILKPPPAARLRYSKETVSSSSLSSPRSPTARLRLPFARRSLWNDDFDPFLAALENVKLKEEKEYGEIFHTPLRALSPQKLDYQKGQNCFEEKSPTRVAAEPKGVFYARQLVKMGQGKPSKEGGAACVGKTKRKKIKRLLRRSASMTMMGNSRKVHKHHDDNPKDESAALPKAKASFTRKLSFRTKGLAQYYNEEQRVSQVLIQYRPKLFLCMGYGSK